MTKNDMDKQKNKTDLPYRKCVGIALFNKDNQVWAGRRITNRLSELKGASKIWQMPQGGIDKGEHPIEAAKRELYEETGVRSIELIAQTEGWLTYDLPEELVGIALKGKYRGQTQKWFAFRFIGDDKEIAINPPPANNTAEFDHWKWVDLEALPMMVVPFKQAVYEKVVAEFRHIIA